MPNNPYECPKVLLNVDQNAKIVIESDLRANVRIFALINVSSHYWSPFHANDCAFSRNEQQKEYKVITPNCKYARTPSKFQKEAAQQVSPCKPLPFHILSMNLYMSWVVSKLLEL